MAGLAAVGASSLGAPAAAILAGLIGVVVIFGSMALAAFLALRYAVSVPALVLERVSAREAIRRSVALTRGSRGRIFLVGLCAVVIAYAGLALFQGPVLVAAVVSGPDTAGAFWFSLAGAVSGTIGSTFTGPIMIIGLALLYYDVRIRKEGLDLQLMMATLDESGTPAPAPSSVLLRS
jgi:hypothetical protein